MGGVLAKRGIPSPEFSNQQATGLSRVDHFSKKINVQNAPGFLKKTCAASFWTTRAQRGEGGRNIHNGIYASRTMLTVQKQWRQGGWPLDAPEPDAGPVGASIRRSDPGSSCAVYKRVDRTSFSLGPRRMHCCLARGIVLRRVEISQVLWRRGGNWCQRNQLFKSQMGEKDYKIFYGKRRKERQKTREGRQEYLHPLKKMRMLEWITFRHSTIHLM